MSRILVTGINGQVGSELMKSLSAENELKGLVREDADFSRPECLRDIIGQYRPEVIINPAAYTAVDKAESEEELAYAVNAIAPAVLAEEARKINALLIHFSTDYVFDGKKQRPYQEHDPTAPINVYGRSKLAGEQAIQKLQVDALIIRTAWVYSHRGNNFLNSMIRLMQERDELGIVDDQTGTPTSAKFLADSIAVVVDKALNQRQKGEFESAVYHLTAGGQASWYDFAREIKMGLEKQNQQQGMADVKPITTAQYPTPARRAEYSVLDCSAIRKAFDVHIPEWQTLLKEELEH